MSIIAHAKPTPALILLFALACTGETTKSTTDTGAATPPDGVCESEMEVQYIVENAAGNCEIHYSHPGSEECNDPARGVAFSGPGNDPGEITITGPDECDIPNETSPPTYTTTSPPDLPDGDYDYPFDWQYAAAQDEDCLPAYPDSNDDLQAHGEETPVSLGNAIECNNEKIDDDTWTVELGPPGAGEDCEDTYPDYEEYVLELLFSPAGGCRQAAMLVPNSGCSPATGVPFDFVYETIYDWDGGTTQHAKLTPIQAAGVPYTERAWIRKIHVTDWGDVTNLHALGWDGVFRVSKSDVIDDTDQFVLSPGTNTVNLAVGDAVMGTVWSVDALPSSDPTFELPSIELDWSCQVDTNDPHYTVVSPPQGFAMKLSDTGMSGVDASQRLIIRFPSTDVMFLYVEGRSDARLDFSLSPATGGGYTFDRTLATHGGVHMAGTVTVNGADRDVTFTDLVINGNDLGTPTWTFEAL